MHGVRRRIGWNAFSLLPIALLLLGAPLGKAAFDQVAILMKPPETGYLLYPRTLVCTPPLAEGAAKAAGAQVTRRYSFRPTPTADAVMPPALGESLNARSLPFGPTASNDPPRR